MPVDNESSIIHSTKYEKNGHYNKELYFLVDRGQSRESHNISASEYLATSAVK